MIICVFYGGKVVFFLGNLVSGYSDHTSLSLSLNYDIGLLQPEDICHWLITDHKNLGMCVWGMMGTLVGVSVCALI